MVSTVKLPWVSDCFRLKAEYFKGYKIYPGLLSLWFRNYQAKELTLLNSKRLVITGEMMETAKLWSKCLKVIKYFSGF